MPDLSFRVEGVGAVPFAATPQVAFKVAVSGASPEQPVQSILLRCQIQIDAPARTYAPEEAQGLRELFGDGAVWDRALRRVLWTHATAIVPGFTRATTFDVHAPCSYDLSIAPGRYFQALVEGDVPVVILFSGTVFHARADGAMQAAPLPWSAEATCRMPVSAWRDAVDRHHSGCAALPLRKDLYDRLQRYRAQARLATWDEAIERLLPPEEGLAP